MTEDRANETVEACEREICLGLDACRRQHPHSTRVPRGVIEQRRLADSRLSAHDETPALAPNGARDQLVDQLAFKGAAEQRLGSLGRCLLPLRDLYLQRLSSVGRHCPL